MTFGPLGHVLILLNGPPNSYFLIFFFQTRFLSFIVTLSLPAKNYVSRTKSVNLGVHLKGSKRVLMGQKSYFLLIKTYFWNICARSGPPQLGVVLVLILPNAGNFVIWQINFRLNLPLWRVEKRGSDHRQTANLKPSETTRVLDNTRTLPRDKMLNISPFRN